MAASWSALAAIDAAVPLLAAAAVGTATAWGAADLAARSHARWRPGPFGRPRPVRRRGWFGAGLLALAAGLAFLTPWRGLYGFLPVAAALAGVWALAGAARRAWAGRTEESLRGREERTRLTVPGILAVAVAAVLMLGAFLGPSNMLLLVCWLVFGPIAADGWFAVRVLRQSRATRGAPAVAAAGEVALVELTLKYRGRFLPAWQVTATDRLRNRREDLAAPVLFARVPPRGEATGVYRFAPRVRGRHVLGPITLSVQFPLGLVRREVVQRGTAELLVLPALGRMTEAWRVGRGGADELAHRARPRKGLFEDEFHQLREYRPGDGPRAIHWPSSAKAGELMVRENRENRDRDLALYLDLHADPGPPGADPGTDGEAEAVRERAVSLAATILVDHLVRHGRATLSLRVGGAEERTYVGRAGGDLAAPLSELALAEAGPIGDPGPAAFAAAAAASPAARRVCVTTRDPHDPALAAADGGGGWDLLTARPGGYERFFETEEGADDAR